MFLGLAIYALFWLTISLILLVILFILIFKWIVPFICKKYHASNQKE